MKYYIDKISLIYNSVDVKPSAVLALFFRMLGIYVHEDIINVSRSEHGQKINSCANIYILSKTLSSEELLEVSKRVAADPKAIVLTDLEGGVASEVSADHIIRYNADDFHEMSHFIGQIARAVIDLNAEELADGKKMLEDWYRLIRIYLDGGLCELTFIGKFFYPNEDLFLEAQKGYIAIIDMLEKTIDRWDENTGQYHHYFAIVNMAYEINALCIRNNEPCIYNSRQIIELCDKLIEMYGTNVSLLMLKGQVHDDLFRDPSTAYKFYKECYLHDSTNVYVLYKVGMYKEKFLRLWEQAIEDYQHALEIYPVYYRVLYRWAICEEQREDQRTAICVYEKILSVLIEKYQNTRARSDFKVMVRPMEIEYLFKAAMRIARLYDYVLKNFDKAVVFYRKAEDIFKLIDESCFISDMLSLEMKEKLNVIIKSLLDVLKAREGIVRYEMLNHEVNSARY